MKYNRNYGIDLLRITLMIFIVIGHLFAHTDIRRQVTFMSNKWWFTWALQAVTVSAVDCFVIITGYYMSSEIYNLWKGVKLWIKVFVYSVMIFIMLVLIGYAPLSVGGGLDAFFPILRNEYWFFTMYLLLYLLIPFLNESLRNMSTRKMSLLIVIIVCFFYIEPLFSVVFYQYDQSEGFSIIAFVTLYVIGAYLRQKKCIPRKYCIIILLGSSSAILMSKVVLQAITEYKNLHFGTGLLYHNNSVFVLINAIALFYLFNGINISKLTFQKAIQWCTPSVFSVYLLHENPLVRKLIWNSQLLLYLEHCGFGWYIVTVLVIPIIIFLTSLVIDKLLMKNILDIIYHLSIMQKIQRACERYNSVVSLSNRNISCQGTFGDE